jgi:putative flippase GtrA
MVNNIMKKKDIFDKIMELPFFRIFEPFYKKYKEILLYLFFGILTMAVSIVSYAICNAVFKINALIANVISWILAVLFAFYTNRIWVFYSKTNSMRELIVQMISFCSGRIVTLIIEEVILFLFITNLHYASMKVKIVAQIVVVILNYIISKLWVFNK